MANVAFNPESQAVAGQGGESGSKAVAELGKLLNDATNQMMETSRKTIPEKADQDAARAFRI